MSRDEKLARQMFAFADPKGSWEGYPHAHKTWISLARHTRALVLAEARAKQRKSKKRPVRLSDGELAIWSSTFAGEYRRQTLGLDVADNYKTPAQTVKKAINLATSAVFAARDANPTACGLDAAEREFLGDILDRYRNLKVG
jgi:hypothetical protein